MTDLTGYAIETLWEEAGFVLSRGTRDGAAPLLVFSPTAPTPFPSALARLDRAFSLRDELSPAWAAVPLALADHGGRAALISEDPGADLLARAIDRPWRVGDFLRLASALAAAVRRLHARGLVHKDIKPANVLWDATRGEAWLTGFGITSRMPRERQSPEAPETLAGTLAYMAPEQTGRMNRSVDARCDLYALGVTFYQLLAGALPFTATDPMEWVHCHIARQPPRGQLEERGVPVVLIDLVMKLLAKTAEDRYQTAAGVEHDLRRARETWDATGTLAPFRLATRDASDRLHVSERLYGREAETGLLLASFERVVARGETALVLVSGYSGIGKSSLVHELHKVLVPPRGLYASGKFDQYKRDIPYATLAQTFEVLIRHILGKGEDEVRAYREKLVRAVGTNGQLMTNLVPELELVIGKQPTVPELPPRDAQLRFQTVVRRFLGVFAQPEHPLALFLDDLQWLDAATLDLLEQIVGDTSIRHLLLVGAYRDNEVGPTHPLAHTLEKLRRSGDRMREIVLRPLEIADVTAICADAVREEPDAVHSLAELVHDKTGGNPFFVIQFIGALVDERLLVFDLERAAWRWDVVAIRAKGFTDNVVDLMARKLHRMPEVTRRALRRLACLGNTVPTATLSLVYETTEEAVHEALAEVLQIGLVVRVEGGYAFLHDRVQEAAYAMVPEGERAAEHLRIGTILAARTPPAELEERIFEIVNHLNRSAGLITAPKDQERVAELNRLASRRAKASIAHEAARTHAAAGRAILGAAGWERSFRLTFDLELQLAECEFLTADLPSAEARLEALGHRATSLVDRAAVISVQTTLYTAMGDRFQHAVEICLGYLRRVGIDWTVHPTPEIVRAEYEQLVARIGGRPIRAFRDLPLLEDPELSGTLDVLMGMMTPAFMTDRGLVCLILCRMGNLGIEHGNNDVTALAYAFLGMVVGSDFGDYRSGFHFGQLARALVEERGLQRHGGRIHHTLGTHVLPWTEPIAVAREAIHRGLRTMNEVGDVTYVGFGYIALGTIAIAGGDPLDRAQRDAEDGLALVKRLDFDIAIEGMTGQLRLFRALRGVMADPTALEEPPRRFLGPNTLGWYWLRTAQACVFFGDFKAALGAMQKAWPLERASMGFFERADYRFYSALVRAAVFDDATDVEKAAHREALARERSDLAVWAENAPENFANRLALVDAEIARIEGRTLDAIGAYERAVALAREHGFIHNEAIASETAARFHAAHGFGTSAGAFLARAHAAYRRWGAVGKVRAMERASPELRANAPSPLAGGSESALEGLDLEAVVKTSQAVSFQVGVGRLIESLMVLVLQHAGAGRGLLVLRRGDVMAVEAEATTGADGVSVLLAHAGLAAPEHATSVLQYAVRTRDAVLIDDAQMANPFSADAYLARSGCRSVLCLPLVKQTEVVGALYLENHLAPRVFTPGRIDVLKLLASQAALSLENATLEEKEALLKEVHHRVKNNLQLISSMLNLQSSRIKDPAVAELFADSRNRVRSMALVHENLYRAGNFSKIPMAHHIKSLCEQLARAYGAAEQGVSFTVDVGALQLDMSRAVTCGLIINELVSNALKHAFSPGQRGRIQIGVTGCGARRHVLRVTDDGVGLPPDLDFGRADSLGLQLVRDLTHQLHGTIQVQRDRGTTFAITFDELAPQIPG